MIRPQANHIGPWLAVLGFMIFLVGGCAHPFLEYCETVEVGETTLPGVTIELCQHQEPFGGEGSMSIRVHLVNETEVALSNCMVILNGEYKASLDGIEMLPRFLGRARPRDHAELQPGEQVRFSLCHETGNREVFRSDDGMPYPRTERVHAVSLEADKGRIKWQVIDSHEHNE